MQRALKSCGILSPKNEPDRWKTREGCSNALTNDALDCISATCPTNLACQTSRPSSSASRRSFGLKYKYTHSWSHSPVNSFHFIHRLAVTAKFAQSSMSHIRRISFFSRAMDIKGGVIGLTFFRFSVSWWAAFAGAALFAAISIFEIKRGRRSRQAGDHRHRSIDSGFHGLHIGFSKPCEQNDNGVMPTNEKCQERENHIGGEPSSPSSVVMAFL